jgi:hypothetical protein
MQEVIVVGMFHPHQQAVARIDQLLERGFRAEDITLLMNDREAQHHFSVARQRQSELPAPFSMPVRQLAARLAPLAPLGTTGSGLVATGPLAAWLQPAMAGGDLARGFLDLGAQPEQANEMVRDIKNNRVLVAAKAAGERIAVAHEVLEKNSEHCLIVQNGRAHARVSSTVRPPASAAGDQSPVYEPRVRPGGEDFPARGPR